MNDNNSKPYAEDFDRSELFMNEIVQEGTDTAYSGYDVFANYWAGQLDLN